MKTTDLIKKVASASANDVVHVAVHAHEGVVVIAEHKTGGTLEVSGPDIVGTLRQMEQALEGDLT